MRRHPLLLAVTGVAILAGASGAAAATPLVVSPQPGTLDASPTTQISILGPAPQAIGSVSVVGSRTGRQSGRLKAYSGNRGASFVPDKAFRQGETVSVALAARGASPRRFSFTIGRVGRVSRAPIPKGKPKFNVSVLHHFMTPPDTTSGIHLAQPFNYHEPIVNGMVQGEARVVDYVWGATGNPGDVPGGGSWHETYEPWGRDMRGTLSWLQANHPTWVMYLSDRHTAATAFGNAIPFLDTTNPDVRRWIVSYEVTLLNSGYQGISWDNGVVYNLSGAAGHFDTAHHWVQQYSGAYSDTDYADAQTAAFAAVTSAIKAARPDTSATLNQSFVCDSLWSAPLASTDMVMDEGGFTNGGIAADPYVTTAAGNGCDNQWLSRVQTEVHLQKDLGKGLVLLNEEPYTVSSHMTDGSSQARFDLQWALANYLLVKYAHSYFWFGGAQQYGGGPILQREYAAPIGSPYDDFRAVGGVYVRDFTNGLALVNPNPTLMMTVTLPTGLYRDLYGVSTDRVLMPPHSGLVLLRPAAISRLRASPAAFPAASAGGSIAAKRKRRTGTTISYTDSQAATTTFTVRQPQAGVRDKRRGCIKPRKRQRVTRSKRCTRYVSAGSFTRSDRAGADRFHFTGRVRRRALRRGSYRLDAAPRAGGRNGRTTSLTFRIVR